MEIATAQIEEAEGWQMTRDSRGRFNGIEPNAASMKRILEEDKKAEHYIAAFEEIGLGVDWIKKQGLVKQWETGHWHIDFRADFMMQGAAMGLAHSLGAGARKIKRIKTLLLVSEALGYMKLWEDLNSKNIKRRQGC
jgi:hypothetical protein